jgi:GT2 family glycosyltransferase
MGAIGGTVYHLQTRTPQSTGIKANRFGKDTSLSPGEDPEPREFVVLMKCNMCARRHVLERVPGFDPAIKIYGEGTDLCIPIARLGCKILYTPKAMGPLEEIFISLTGIGSI